MQATPTGRLMAKTQRQPTVVVSTPPTSGPAVAATPAIAPHSPNARARAAASIDLLQQRQRARHEQRGAEPSTTRITVRTVSSGASMQPSERA